jgi:hypothetical protein
LRVPHDFVPFIRKHIASSFPMASSEYPACLRQNLTPADQLIRNKPLQRV